MSTYDKVTAELDAIRGCADAFIEAPLIGAAFAAAERLPALVRVADAVLALHHPADRGRVLPCCAGCEDAETSAHGCVAWLECPTVEGITAALAGEDGIAAEAAAVERECTTAGLVLVWYDERNREICRSIPLRPGTRRIGIPLDAQHADLIRADLIREDTPDA